MFATTEEILVRIRNAPVVNDRSVKTAGTVREYKGEGSWLEWIKSFEAAACKSSMDDTAKLQWFKALLSGPLKASLKDVKPLNYSRAKEVVCLRLFSTREKKSYEQWCDLAKELITLVMHGCPDKDQSEYDEMVKERILVLAHDSTLQKNIPLQHLVNILMAKDAIPQAYSGRIDGETSWDSWIQKFESAVVKNQLDDLAKIQWLQARLTDDALKTFHEVQSQGKISYALVRKALHTKVYAERFDARGKKDNESFDDYAKVLLTLFKEAYPDDKEKEKKVLHRLKPHMHYFLQSKEFKSVDEAITADCAVNTIKDAFKNDTSDDWSKWIAFFDDKCKEQCLDSSKRLVWLETRLAEKALKCYEELPAQSRQLYETAKRDFQAKLYKNSFDAKCKCKFEVTRISELADELSNLSIGAFPDETESSRDGIVLKQILNMIKDKGMQFILQPQTLREAVHFVHAVKEIPNEYTGGKEWYSWVEKADKFISHNETIKNHEKVRCICSRLRGKAMQLFQDVSRDDGLHFEDILTTFQKKLYDYWLQMTKDVSTGWEAYANDLLILGEKVPYSKEQCEHFVLNHMLTQVSEPYKSKKWTSLDEAINIISAAEELDTYSNTEDEIWEDWISKFEKNAMEHSFDDAKKVARLASRLVHTAKEAFDKLAPVHKRKYSDVIHHLKASLYVQKFVSKQRKQTQGLFEYKQELLHLAEMAYPCCNTKQREMYVLRHILEMAKEPHKSRQWSSLNEAVNIISAEEDVPAYSNADSENWEEWIKTFADASQHIAYDKDKLETLRSRLFGNALIVFDKLDPSCKVTYSSGVDHLRKALYLARFNSKARPRDQGLQQYVQDLQLLAEKIYPGNDGMKELLVLDRLKCNINDRYRSIVWRSVDEAVRVISAAEKVPVYANGDQENWGQWKNMLQTAANECKLETGQMISLLSCCLTGRAKKSFDDMLNTQTDITLEKLQNRLCHERFMLRKKKPCETWRTLKIDLCSLADYSGGELLQTTVLDRFRSIIKDSGIVLYKEPESLDDAVGIVTLQEAVPNKYSGDADWMEWITEFESALSKPSIDNDAIKLKYLESWLTDWALETFHKIPKSDYSEAKCWLKISFYEKQFNDMRKPMWVEWSSFAITLLKAGINVYSKEKLTKNVVDKILSDHPHTHIWVGLETSILDAVAIAQAKDVIQVTFFNDMDQWDSWIAGFEEKVKSHNLTERAKLLWFHASLDGKAREVDMIINKTVSSYEGAKSGVERYIFEEAYNSKLKSDNETVQSLATTLQRYAEKAFPEQDADMNALKRLIELMDPEGSLGGGIETLSDGVVIFTALEAIQWKRYRDGDDWKQWINCCFEREINARQCKIKSKICHYCRKGFGTEGCTPIGTEKRGQLAKHNCTV